MLLAATLWNLEFISQFSFLFFVEEKYLWDHFLIIIFEFILTAFSYTEKNGFVTATKLGTTNNFFVAATKNFAAATKRFVDKTKHFVVKNIFAIPILTNDFVGITKPFIPCILCKISNKSSLICYRSQFLVGGKVFLIANAKPWRPLGII